MISLNDIKNTNYADQYISALPAAPADSLLDVQFTHILNEARKQILASTKIKQKQVREWADAALNEANDISEYKAFRQSIRTIIEKWITSNSNDINPINVIEQAVETIFWSGTDLAHLSEDELIVIGKNNPTPEDYVAFSTALKWPDKVLSNLNALTPSTFDISSKIKKMIFDKFVSEFNKIGLKYDGSNTETAYATLNNYLANFDYTQSLGDTSFLDFTALNTSIKNAKFTIDDVISQFIDSKKVEQWITTTTGDDTLLSPVTKMVNRINLELAQEELDAHFTATTKELPMDNFDPLFPIAGTSNSGTVPSGSDLYKPEYLNLIFVLKNPSDTSYTKTFTQVLAEHHITLDAANIRISYTKENVLVDGVTNQVNSKRINMNVSLLTNQSTTNVALNPVSFIIEKHVPKINELMGEIQGIVNDLVKADSSIIQAKTLHENDIINLGIPLITNAQQLADAIAAGTWFDIDVAKLKSILGLDDATYNEIVKKVDAIKEIKSEITNQPFDMKVQMQISSTGQINYKFIAIGGGPNTAQVDVTEKSIAWKTTKIDYASYIQELNKNGIIASFRATDKTWLEDIIGSANLNTWSDAYIDAMTNKNEILDAIRRIFAGIGMDATEVQTRLIDTARIQITKDIATNTYLATFVITDPITKQSTNTGPIPLRITKAIEAIVYSGRTVQSVFNPEKNTNQIYLRLSNPNPPENDPDFSLELVMPDGSIQQGNVKIGNPVDLSKVTFSHAEIAMSDFVNWLKTQGITITNYDPSKGILPTFIYLKDSVADYKYDNITAGKPDDIGVDLVLRIDSMTIEGTPYSKTVTVFIPLVSHEASDEEKMIMSNKIDAKRDSEFKVLDTAKAAQKITQEEYDKAKTEINQIVNKFKEDIANKISAAQLRTLDGRAEDAINNIMAPLKSKLNQVSAELIAKIVAILGYMPTDPSILDTIAKYEDTLKSFLDTNPNAQQLMNMLNNPNFLKWMKYFPPKMIPQVMKALQKTSANYKYGYFGGGVALGAAGIAAGAAALSTGIAAKKTAKHSNAIKIRGHKLITIVTSAISLATLGGAVALMIYFFTQQGGF